jgi:hypothetical protein
MRPESEKPEGAGKGRAPFGLIDEFWQRGVLVTLAAFKTGD